MKVFLSYARQDELSVRELYTFLSEHGCDPWMDVEKLRPGQNWELEIEDALESSDFVIVCLSNTSVDKTGFVQKELRKAISLLDERPEGKIFLIPVRLDDCEVPRRLRSLNWLDWFDELKRPNLLMSIGISVTEQPREVTILAGGVEFRYDTEFFRSIHGKDRVEYIHAMLLAKRHSATYAACEDLLKLDYQNPLVNLLAAISLFRGQGADALSDDRADIVQAHLQYALSNQMLEPTALVVLAVIKHDFYLLNGLSEGTPSLRVLSERIHQTSNARISPLLDLLKISSIARTKFGL